MKEKYFMTAMNEAGAVLKLGKYNSYKEAAKDARRQLGAGWRVEICNEFGEPVMSFTIRKN